MLSQIFRPRHLIDKVSIKTHLEILDNGDVIWGSGGVSSCKLHHIRVQVFNNYRRQSELRHSYEIKLELAVSLHGLAQVNVDLLSQFYVGNDFQHPHDILFDFIAFILFLLSTVSQQFLINGIYLVRSLRQELL